MNDHLILRFLPKCNCYRHWFDECYAFVEDKQQPTYVHHWWISTGRHLWAQLPCSFWEFGPEHDRTAAYRSSQWPYNIPKDERPNNWLVMILQVHPLHQAWHQTFLSFHNCDFYSSIFSLCFTFWRELQLMVCASKYPLSQCYLHEIHHITMSSLHLKDGCCSITIIQILLRSPLSSMRCCYFWMILRCSSTLGTSICLILRNIARRAFSISLSIRLYIRLRSFIRLGLFLPTMKNCHDLIPK